MKKLFALLFVLIAVPAFGRSRAVGPIKTNSVSAITITVQAPTDTFSFGVTGINGLWSDRTWLAQHNINLLPNGILTYGFTLTRLRPSVSGGGVFNQVLDVAGYGFQGVFQGISVGPVEKMYPTAFGFMPPTAPPLAAGDILQIPFDTNDGCTIQVYRNGQLISP